MIRVRHQPLSSVRSRRSRRFDAMAIIQCVIASFVAAMSSAIRATDCSEGPAYPGLPLLRAG
jgi:hypothetical protein